MLSLPRKRGGHNMICGDATAYSPLTAGETAVADNGASPMVVAPAPSASIALSIPGMAGPLSFDPTPYSIDLGVADETYVSASSAAPCFCMTSRRRRP